MDDFTANALLLAGVSARRLGWSPATFWAATPEELAASLDTPEARTTPPTRGEIAALMERDADGR